MPPKKKDMSRREFIRTGFLAGVAGALGWGAFRADRKLGGLLKTGDKSPIQRTLSVRPVPEARTRRRELREIKPPRDVPQRQLKRNLLIYREGLSGEALAKAYGVKYTHSPRFTPSKALMHDIKVLLAVECERYNKKSSFNPRGEQLVDPYQLFSIFSKESNFNPSAVGGHGELGIGQLKPGTINDRRKDRKLPVNVTDPFDLRQGITAAVRHAVWLYENLETKTIFRRYAAWNQGIGAASDKSHKKWAQGNKYANEAWTRHKKYKAEGALQGYA